MIVTRKHLSRRTLLQGFGTALALPMLDAMVPALGRAASVAGSATAAPTRLAFTYVPNGVNYATWRPKGEGASYELSRTLKPLEKFREDMLVLTNLDIHNG